MNPKTKKYIIAGALGVISIAAAAAYLQYKKLMDYTIKFKTIRVNKASMNLFDFNLFLNFINKSNVEFVIESQVYNAYINNVFVTKLENQVLNKIAAKSTNVIGLNVKFNPNQVLDKIGKNAVSLLASADKTIIKIDIKLKVKLWFFRVNIPFIYEDSLKNMMTPKPVE